MRRSKKYIQTSFYCMAIFVFFAMTGCFLYSGSEGHMRFDELKYPASMSAYLYGPNNELLAKDRELQVIGRFSYKMNFWGTFYSGVPLTGTKDVSKEVNNKIEASGGDGIINVKVTSKPGSLTLYHPLTALPFWPSYTEVLMEGEIVKYDPTMIRNAPHVAVPMIPGDVHILEKSDQAMTIRLSEQCRPIGKVETVTFRTETHLFRATSLKHLDLVEFGILNGIKLKAREKDANVVQVLFLNNSYRGKALTFTQEFSRDFDNVAVDVRYWSCPL